MYLIIYCPMKPEAEKEGYVTLRLPQPNFKITPNKQVAYNAHIEGHKVYRLPVQEVTNMEMKIEEDLGSINEQVD
jgi:hypothetical protein